MAAFVAKQMVGNKLSAVKGELREQGQTETCYSISKSNSDYLFTEYVYF